MLLHRIGLASYDLGNFDTAATFLARAQGRGQWRLDCGRRYNLGRTYEAQAAAAREPDQRKALLAQAVETYRGTFLGLPPDSECLYRASR